MSFIFIECCVIYVNLVFNKITISKFETHDLIQTQTLIMLYTGLKQNLKHMINTNTNINHAIERVKKKFETHDLIQTQTLSML